MFELVSNYKSAVLAINAFSKDKNFELVSAKGYSHIVYAHKNHPGWVIKLPRSVKLAKSDKNIKFIDKLCKQELATKNPLFPKIYDNRVHYYNDGTYAIIMERLQIKTPFIEKLICDMTQKAASPATVLESFDTVLLECATEPALGQMTAMICRVFRIDPKHMVEYMGFILGIIDNKKDLDLQSENMGFRDNGQLVFFDPIAA